MLILLGCIAMYLGFMYGYPVPSFNAENSFLFHHKQREIKIKNHNYA
jgi:hypothetical protein